jgi:dethiobiotin synthetase
MKYFISGIGTDIGKTVASAILVQALKSDYWKPIQSGDLNNSDSHKIKEIISYSDCHFFEETYRLNQPLSPHASAQLDGIEIDIKKFDLPKSKNLIIEGAGGLLVPLNQKDTILDLIIELGVEVILISKHYLGSINHTLLTVDCLQNNNIPIKGIIFNGEENKATESIILSKTKVPFLGRIEHIEKLNKESIKKASLVFKDL